MKARLIEEWGVTPEQKARQKIDQQLDQCGWMVQDYREMNISAGLGVAVREFPLKTGDADYLLYADGKAIGVIEAKPEGHTLTGVETQSAKYTDGPARRAAALPSAAAVRLRIHRHRHPVHQLPRPRSPAAGRSSPSIGPRN